MTESMGRIGADFARWAAAGGGVAITGASGWIGRAMTQAALDAGCRNLRLLGSRARTFAVAGRPVTQEPLDGAPALGAGEWLVLHLAVAGADRIPDPQALRARNEAMLADAVRLAGTGEVRRFVCASSGAVYAPPQADPVRQAYNDLKRDQEQIVQAWARRSGAPVLFPRIFNVGGPYMNHVDRYALGNMIRQAMDGRVIRIQARHRVLRSYVHVLELARVTYALALGEERSLAFDTAGVSVVEMAELAHAVGRALGLKLGIERPHLEGAEPDRYVGDGTLYRSALDGPQIGLDQIIRATAAWLKAA